MAGLSGFLTLTGHCSNLPQSPAAKQTKYKKPNHASVIDADISFRVPGGGSTQALWWVHLHLH